MEVYRWENPPTEWGVSSHATFDDTEGSSRNSSWSTHVPPKWALQVHGVPITTPHCFSRNRMIQMNPNDVSMVSVLGFPDFFCTSRTFFGMTQPGDDSTTRDELDGRASPWFASGFRRPHSENSVPNVYLDSREHIGSQLRSNKGANTNQDSMLYWLCWKEKRCVLICTTTRGHKWIYMVGTIDSIIKIYYIYIIYIYIYIYIYI
jgi:hypothetical protein